MTTSYAPTTIIPSAIASSHSPDHTWALYRRACWLLRNLIAREACTFQEAYRARLQIAEALGWIHALTKPPWDGPRNWSPAATRDSTTATFGAGTAANPTAANTGTPHIYRTTSPAARTCLCRNSADTAHPRPRHQRCPRHVRHRPADSRGTTRPSTLPSRGCTRAGRVRDRDKHHADHRRNYHR